MFDPPPSLQDACLLSIGSNLHRFDITGLGTDGLSHDIAARLLQASADEKTLDDESLLYLLSLCGAQLESFSIPFANVTAGAIDQAVAALPCAALLRLNGLPVNDDTLIVIAKKCPDHRPAALRMHRVRRPRPAGVYPARRAERQHAGAGH